MNPEDQNNQNTKFNWNNRNKILLAVVVVVIVALGFYWLLRKDSNNTAEGTDGVKHEAVPAVVLNAAADKLWVSFPLEEDKKGEFAVSSATSIVRLDFTSNGPQENKISLAELKQGDNILVYYQIKNNDRELNRVEFLNFPPPPEGIKVPTNPPAF